MTLDDALKNLPASGEEPLPLVEPHVSHRKRKKRRETLWELEDTETDAEGEIITAEEILRAKSMADALLEAKGRHKGKPVTSVVDDEYEYDNPADDDERELVTQEDVDTMIHFLQAAMRFYVAVNNDPRKIPGDLVSWSEFNAEELKQFLEEWFKEIES